MPDSECKPISWEPSQYWDGDDGTWSSFSLRVGRPEQTCRVLISTAATSTWVVIPQGCTDDDPIPDCAKDRGGIFDASRSQSWKNLGIYGLGPNELNLGYNNSAGYGLDTVSLGFSNATGGPTLANQVVAGYSTYDYYLGSFGLNNQPTNFTNLTNSHPSFLSTLRSNDLIPSLSWAYTAGAHYQSKGVLGSLTFGGYDSSRIKPNNVSFWLASDVTRDVVVGLQSITSSYANGSAIPLLPRSVWTFIDSTLPFIYLPSESCLLFERALGLKWNDTSELYEVDDALHQSLLQSNPTFTFQLGNSLSGESTVDIELPYASFDLVAKDPFVSVQTRYFPLQRASNDSQLTLGRTFLQEAYLAVNYDHANFSLYQAQYIDGTKPNIVALPSTAPPHKTGSQSRKIATIAGSSAGAAILILILTLLILTLYVRRLRQKSKGNRSPYGNPMSHGRTLSSEFASADVSGLHEISTHTKEIGEMGDTGRMELLDTTMPSGSGKPIHELRHASKATDVWEMATSLTTPRHSLPPASSMSPMVSSVKCESKTRLAIMVSQRISRDTCTSFATTVDSPVVETTISAATQRSLPWSDRSEVSQDSDWSRSTYLNKELPPDPPSKTQSIMNQAMMRYF